MSLTNPFDPGLADTAAGFHYAFAIDSPPTVDYAQSGTDNSASFPVTTVGSYPVYGCVIDKDNGYTMYEAVVNVSGEFYNFSGFLPPLSQNIAFALGRTIPIKFQLTDAGGRSITALSAVETLQVAPVNADGTRGTPFNPTATGNTALRNDRGQYVFNWQTKGLSAGSYEILLTLDDGSQAKTKVIQLSKNGGSAKLTADSVTAAAGGATAGALLGGDVALFVDSQGGQFDADELARVQDAISAINGVVGPYGVSIYQVDAAHAADANVILEMSTTSVVGGFAEGVLGCSTDLGEITLIQGWNWYASADAGLIAADQYDFQTVVTHEVGHALGLGHSDASTSVMYATLASGVTSRALTSQDLNVADNGGGPAALRAVPRQAIAADVGFWTATSGQSSEAQDAMSTWPAALPSAVRRTSERDSQLDPWRKILDGRAVRAVLESADTPSQELMPSLPLGTAGWPESGWAWRDQGPATWSNREAVDLVLEDFDSIAPEDGLVNAIALGQQR